MQGMSSMAHIEYLNHHKRIPSITTTGKQPTENDHTREQWLLF